jgi:hypothetical protein
MSSMEERSDLIKKLKNLNGDGRGFNELALDVFKYQYKHNKIYNKFVTALGLDVNTIRSYDQIPALPIQFFKTHEVKSFSSNPKMQFESSGTSGMQSSRHLVYDDALYRDSCTRLFADAFDGIENFCFLALLPSYLERKSSSLVYMLDHFITQSSYSESGFYLYDFKKLNATLSHCKSKEIPTILFGVSFALLDFLATYSLDFPKLILIETGGMKGRKKEMIKSDIIQEIRRHTTAHRICSEYGMTELFSQFYAKDGLNFELCRTARAETVQLNDPFTLQIDNKPGLLKITDLCNIDSCSFILTEDIAKMNRDSTFEVIGRADNSTLRGCNLLYAG